MINKRLNGKRVAVLVDMGFEQVELTEPVKALQDAGASVFIVSNHAKVKGWKEKEWGDDFNADVLLEKAEAYQYDALLLPGGVMNPDHLRMNPMAVQFVKHFLETGKPVAAICHGPWTLVETGLIKGRLVTSYSSIKTDLINAGALWQDREVVTDKGLVTSRNPGDLPAFNEKMIEEFAEGVHIRNKKGVDVNQYTQRPSIKNEGRLNENIDDRNWEELTDRDPHDDL